MEVLSLNKFYVEFKSAGIIPAGISRKKLCRILLFGGSGGYRFLSYLKNIAVNSDMQKISLLLKLDNKITPFDKGISLSSHYEASLCYWIPAGVYSTFEACLGLHTDSLNQKSGVKIQLINNCKTVQEYNFYQKNHLSELN